MSDRDNNQDGRERAVSFLPANVDERLPIDSGDADSGDDPSEGCRPEGSFSNPVRDSVARLKRIAFRVSEKGFQATNPFFWSYFRSEVSRIRAEKENKRTLQGLFGSADEYPPSSE